MFESTLNVNAPSRRSLGAGALFSAVTHAAVIGAVIFAAGHALPQKIEAPEVVFRPLAALAPPPPPPLGGGSEVKVEPKKKPIHVNPDSYVPITTAQAVVEPEPAPADSAAGEPGGEIGGEVGGVIGGTKGGKVGGTIGGTGTEVPVVPVAPTTPPPPVNQVLPFGEGMNRPQLVGGPEPVFPREALEARVEGTLLARCVITTEGALTNCRIIKSLPFLDQPVLAALAQRRYTPVSFQGRAVAVEYTIPFKFKLQ
jgi:protein TonB